MKKLVPVILALGGLGAGVGAGFMLRPDSSEPSEHAAVQPDGCAPPDHAMADPELPIPHEGPSEFVRLGSQFVIPILGQTSVTAMVMLSLSLEVAEGSKDDVINREPKIRDAMLRVLFDHSNAGGFNGNFIDPKGLDDLRHALREAAQKSVGSVVYDVLVTDMLRQTT